jgi:hypothetical protein
VHAQERTGLAPALRPHPRPRRPPRAGFGLTAAPTRLPWVRQRGSQETCGAGKCG